ncbi:MAG: NAD(P)-dependent oxidoreductase [Pseudomonadota bacterium]
MRVAFLGLGVMGYPMAGHLARAGHEVTVYNRTRTTADRWCEAHNGTQGATPAEAAIDADIVFACVGNDSDIQEVALGQYGAIPAMAPGTIFVDHTTTSADQARRLDAAARQHGVGFVDAPVSGGQSGAEAGRLTVMCGGTIEHCERVAPVADAYSARWARLGPAGAGQLTKMVNQICIGGLLQALSEGVQFAQLAGLDPEAVFATIGGGAAQSWQMDNRATTMAKREFDFGFAVEWMQKDLGFALAEAKRNGASLPVTEMVTAFYDEVASAGGHRWDTSSLITRFDTESSDDG